MKITALCFVLLFARDEVFGQGRSTNSAQSSQVAETDFSEPGPVQLLDFGSSENKTVTLKKGSLEKLFLDPAVSHRNVVVVSIAGAFRKGKSFLLNYLLRYLYANYKSVSQPNKIINATEGDAWLGSQDEPLKGFSWKSSTKRETSGIIFWSDVFLYDSPKGDKIAIYLMDTQGLFDHSSSPTDNIRIFSLSALMSSVQLMNIFSMIEESHLEYLQFATEIARFSAVESSSLSKPFQKLIFVIRDWVSPDEYEYGLDGGNKFIKKFLSVRDFHTTELKIVREYLQSTFESISCFLMPYPGKAAARNSTFDGRWSALEEEFVDTLRELMPAILSPANLTIKTVGGSPIQAFELSVYIKQYVDLFKDENLPEAKSIYESTLDNQFQILMSKAIEVYLQSVSLYQEKIHDVAEVDRLHQLSKSLALKYFDDEKKFGIAEEGLTYHKELEDNIEKAGNEWKPITIEFLSKISQEQSKADDQNKLAATAGKREEKAKEDSRDADAKYIELQQRVAQARYDTEESRREAEIIRRKLDEADAQRNAALQREQEARSHYEAMKEKAQYYEKLLKAEKENSMRRFNEKVHSVRETNGVLRWFGKLASSVLTVLSFRIL